MDNDTEIKTVDDVNEINLAKRLFRESIEYAIGHEIKTKTKNKEKFDKITDISIKTAKKMIGGDIADYSSDVADSVFGVNEESIKDFMIDEGFDAFYQPIKDAAENIKERAENYISNGVSKALKNPVEMFKNIYKGISDEVIDVFIKKLENINEDDKDYESLDFHTCQSHLHGCVD